MNQVMNQVMNRLNYLSVRNLLLRPPHTQGEEKGAICLIPTGISLARISKIQENFFRNSVDG
jgi:hypothetical protein